MFGKKDRIADLLRGNLGVIIISSGIWNIALMLAMPYFSLYILSLGGSFFDVSFTNAVGSICMVFPMIFAGTLADIVGRKSIVVYLGFLISLVYFIFSQAPSWEYLVLGQALNFLINGFRVPAFSAILADSTDPRDRALAFALWQRVPQAMTIASPLIGGYIIDILGVVPSIRFFYIIIFFASLIAQIIRLKFLQETLKTERKNIFEELKSALLVLKDIPSKTPKEVTFLIFINSLLSFGLSVPAPFWVIFGTEDVIGLKAFEWGFITIVETVIMIFSTIFFAVAADKYGDKKFIVSSLLLSPLIIALFPYAKNFLEVLAIRSILSLITSLRSAPLSAILTDYSPRIFRGRIYAFQGLFTLTSAGFGNLLGGYFYQNVSKQLPFFTEAIMIIISSVLFIFLIKEPINNER
jgi:DHA1 family multidrug resistance protein-like MFS transporter